MAAGKRTNRVRHANQAANCRKNRQHNQRYRHRKWRFVRLMCDVVMMFVMVMISFTETLVAPESHHHQTRHVNRGQQSRDYANKPQSLCRSGRQIEWSGDPNLPKNFVFRKKAGPDWHAADRQPSADHRDPGDWHVFAQTAHATHVLLVMHAMND